MKRRLAKAKLGWLALAARTSHALFSFAKIYIISLIIVLSVKIVVAYVYTCGEPGERLIISYKISSLSPGPPGEVGAARHASISGKALLVIEEDRVTVVDLNSSEKILEMVRVGGSYYYVLRDGGLLEAGISPFYLPRPCVDPVISGVFKFRYFNINLDYKFILYNIYWEGKLYSLGLGVRVFYPGESGDDYIIDYYLVSYVGGVGVSGTVAVPRAAVLSDSILGNLVYSPVYKFRFLVIPSENEYLPRGVFDVYPIALPGVAAGLALAYYGLARLLRVGRRGGG